jgi:hypothetical protein
MEYIWLVKVVLAQLAMSKLLGGYFLWLLGISHLCQEFLGDVCHFVYRPEKVVLHCQPMRIKYLMMNCHWMSV